MDDKPGLGPLDFGAARRFSNGPRRPVILGVVAVVAFALGWLLSGCSSSEEGPCAGVPLGFAERETTTELGEVFVPAVEFYSVENEGRSIVLYVEADSVNASYMLD